jgi:predicted AAA+ superfamily ATPase
MKNVLNLDHLFNKLSSFYGVTLYKRDSVIILDSIQNNKYASQAIKTLVADGRYDYIEIRSLLSSNKNVDDRTHHLEEIYVNMYPLDFEEFCNAMDESMLMDYTKKCFNDNLPLDRGFTVKQ